jgi:AcrR family transcriptional regulator
MPDRRAELLEDCLKYMLEQGIATLSLRPLAAKVGTSARLLVYHFGSREGLITAVMSEVRERLQASFLALAGARTPPDPMTAFWKRLTQRDLLRCVGLLFEVQLLAIRAPRTYARYLDDSSSSWLSLIQGALPPSKATPAMATLCAAVFDGLILELLSTGDRRRTSDALALFRDMLHAASKRTTVK